MWPSYKSIEAYRQSYILGILYILSSGMVYVCGLLMAGAPTNNSVGLMVSSRIILSCLVPVQGILQHFLYLAFIDQIPFCMIPRKMVDNLPLSSIARTGFVKEEYCKLNASLQTQLSIHVFCIQFSQSYGHYLSLIPGALRFPILLCERLCPSKTMSAG